MKRLISVVVLSNIFSLFGLAIYRIISPSIFLFEQILVTSLVAGFFSIILIKFPNPVQPQTFNGILAITSVLSILFSYSLTTSSIMQVDRSRSVYVIAWVDQFKSEQKIENFVSNNFGGVEKTALHQRIQEQISRGFIAEPNDGELTLSKKGKVLLRVAIVLAATFNLESYYLHT
jgi:hypothetical protein